MYIVSYSVCGFIIYLVALFCTIVKKKLDKVQNRVFAANLAIGVSDTFFNTMSANVLNWTDKSFPTALAGFFHTGYYASHAMMELGFIIYVLICSGLTYRDNKKTYISCFVPWIITEIIVLSNPVTNFMYSLGKDGSFDRGMGVYLLYIIAIYYFILCNVYVFKYKTALGGKFKMIVFFIFFSAFGAVIQLVWPKYLLELFFESLAYVGVLLTIENEDEEIHPITKCYNKTSFVKDMNKYLDNNIKYCLVELDLENIDYLSATLGIDKMNRIQREIADWFNSFDKRLSVYDCDEGRFIIAGYGQDKEEKILEVRDKIKEVFSEGWKSNDLLIPLETQLVFFRVPEDMDSIEGIMAVLDRRKDIVHERFHEVKDKELKSINRKFLVEKAMEKAINNHSFQVYYQPIYNVKKDCYDCAEALTRLFDDELGLIVPDEFIPIAEKSGMIFEMGEQIFRQVCRDMTEKRFLSLGIEYIVVNLSPVQCMKPTLVRNYKKVINEYGMDPMCINFEINESAMNSLDKKFLEAMGEFKKMGFRFSIDDYGMSLVNLEYLYTIDFDIIKLDKRLLWRKDDNIVANNILEGTIEFFKKIGKKILIKGVETESQKEYLVEKGCDFIQGFLCSKPLTCRNFVDFCENFIKQRKK
ncbi:EAL domain, c-di-GMP-specific phosphodiesterase class I (or its enzymatically inactive variant) [Acetitomaculum ruminis DSM 5522]|uniref:EAL domain, c-di-GMP-specific phosphodiesterase class I (Or its enzymatically inactive variant) n=1 Tax=Acetitomaculum ruminis DSM 5522 TaxID=1120918 RepID=A0A1I0W6L6_9FIRM|nr:EAL domain-containing protein [Acetitomaculum ruminis]SFA84164.1 EAL domain, c-di-GMP-specific phosphodiesterase class I (or its enzymatically inactive variant) [Acetitomaculum ruminis DSM 5522]